MRGVRGSGIWIVGEIVKLHYAVDIKGSCQIEAANCECWCCPGFETILSFCSFALDGVIETLVDTTLALFRFLSLEC